MRIPRVYLDSPLSTGALVPLDARAHHHLINVLRLSANDELRIFNGTGGEYKAVLEQVSRKASSAQLIELHTIDRESTLQIHLLQGVSKADHMDQTIQKAIELGVSGITPVFTERSNGRLSGERLAKKMLHWQGIIISACEQCGRNTIPGLNNAVSLMEIAPLASGSRGIMLVPGGHTPLVEVQPANGEELTILIGAEGGLTSGEVDMAGGKGFRPVRLGNRILRTETAGLAIIAIAQMLWGDLGS